MAWGLAHSGLPPYPGYPRPWLPGKVWGVDAPQAVRSLEEGVCEEGAPSWALPGDPWGEGVHPGSPWGLWRERGSIPGSPWVCVLGGRGRGWPSPGQLPAAVGAGLSETTTVLIFLPLPWVRSPHG